VERLLDLLELEAAPSRVVAVAMLLAVRLAPLTLIAPAIAVRGVPALVRTTLLLALVLGLLPTALATAPALPDHAVGLTLLGLREAVLGSAFALVVSIPIFAADHAGRAADQLRGGGQAEITLPSGERTSLLGGAAGLFAVALFAASGGHRALVLGLAATLRTSPPGQGASATDLAPVLAESAELLTRVLAIGLSLAAPAVVALVAADASLAVIARTAPQLPVHFAAMPLRAWLGVAAVLLALAWLTPELTGLFADFLRAAESLG
jgi:type III secretory pathway component EscT